MSKLKHLGKDYVIIRRSVFNDAWLKHPRVLSDHPLYLIYQGVEVVLIKVELTYTLAVKLYTKLTNVNYIIGTHRQAKNLVAANKLTGYYQANNDLVTTTTTTS